MIVLTIERFVDYFCALKISKFGMILLTTLPTHLEHHTPSQVTTTATLFLCIKKTTTTFFLGGDYKYFYLI